MIVSSSSSEEGSTKSLLMVSFFVAVKSEYSPAIYVTLFISENNSVLFGKPCLVMFESYIVR
ncbi:MAG: hypothetical protein ACI83H_001518 [Glaciecola sp.]|jgi:hypothetical protein